MDEKELQELKLEEIMREFHEDSEGAPEDSQIQTDADEEGNAEQPDPGRSDAELTEQQEPEREEKPDQEVPPECSSQKRIPETERPAEESAKPATEENPLPENSQETPAEESVSPMEDTLQETQTVTDDTIRMDLPPRVKPKVKSDTIRLDGIKKKLPRGKVRGANPVVSEETQVLDIPAKEEPFSEHWEPEYEQPIGEYVPPQPIMFQPRSRLKELKKDLVAGPEKRFYELSEKGFGKIQSAIFISMIVDMIAITATVIYGMGMVTEDRMRLMAFGQFFTMLVSGLLGVNLMMDGITDLFHGKFNLNTMLVFTFAACCIDGVFCLQQLRVPCCAAFCLQVTLALLSEYEKRRIEISQMDTMRKANRLDGVAECPDYYEGIRGLLRKEARVDEFMDTYSAPSKQQKIMQIYAVVALASSAAVAVLAGIRYDLYEAFHVWAVTLLAAVPATAFIALSRPFAVLESRLHSLGTVLCGWKGIQKLSGKAVIPLTHEDVYPAGSARLNGVKFYGSRKPDEVVAYCTAVIAAENGGLAEVFRQVLDSRNGYHYDAKNLTIYDGGIGAEVEEEPVLVGSQVFLRKMGVEIPEGIHVNHAVWVSIDGEFSGLFAVSYDKVRASHVGVNALCGCPGLQPVVISSDFSLTSQFLQSKFGINPRKILLPEQDVRQQLREKTLSEDADSLLLTTRTGLAPMALGITGARALRTAGNLGVAVHLIGGLLGIGMMTVLVLLGALHLLTPVNMFLYQLVWMIPGFLITEWTRTV